MRTSTMWEPGTSAAHGVEAGLKIRNSKFEMRNQEGGWAAFRIPNFEFRIRPAGPLKLLALEHLAKLEEKLADLGFPDE